MLRQMKQFFSLTATLALTLSVVSTVRAECFNASGRAGVIKNLNRPWVFTVYLPDKAPGEGHYRVKSFGVNLTGKLDCKSSKTYCSSDRGGVSLKKTSSGLEMKFSQDLAVEKRNESEEVAEAPAQPSNQLFNLDAAHSDICYDAFFKESKYDDYAKAHGNQISFPLGKNLKDAPAPAVAPPADRSASVEEAE